MSVNPETQSEMPAFVPVPVTSNEQESAPSIAAHYRAGLPVLSASLFRLNQILSRSPVDLTAVDQLVESDPILAAQLLRFAKAEGVCDGRLCCLRDCIVLLGASAVRNLVFTSAIAPTDALTTLRLRALCQHGHLSAVLTRRIALHCGYVDAEFAHLAALLHDIGKVPLILSCSQRDLGRASAEFASWHTSIGARLSKSWKLPTLISEVIEYHHNPAGARRDPLLVRMVSIADRICHAHGVGLHAAPAITFKPTDYADIFSGQPALVSSGHEIRLAELLESDFLRWLAAVRTW